MTMPKNGQPSPRARTLSAKNATFLLQVLDSLTLAAGDPGFDEVVTSITSARRELRAIVGVQPKRTSTTQPSSA